MGINIVQKDNKPYLVYIGPENNGRVTIESFMLNVIDLSDLKNVLQSYVKFSIEFEIQDDC